MSEHQHDGEDMLETMERIADEQGVQQQHDDDASDEHDDDSFDAEAIYLTRGDSAIMDQPARGERRTSFLRDESMGADEQGTAVFVMGEDVEFGLEQQDLESFDDSQSTEVAMAYQRRGSHNSRRSSFSSAVSSHSANSARESPSSGASDANVAKSSRPARRKSIKLTSFRATGSDDANKKPPAKSMRPLARLSKMGPSTRRAGTKSDDSASAFMAVGQMGNTQLQDTAAAAAVVALSEEKTTSKRIQFVVDDVVLVFLNILNLMNQVDPPEAFTVVPVNQYGFPPGEGHRPAEQQGPYVYVMATVKRVHFDEDVPYYTVTRADTNADQRAESGWMEPLTDYHGIEAATRAAQQTGFSEVDLEQSTREKDGCGTRFVACLLIPINFVNDTIVPWYQEKRSEVKEHVRHVLWGDAPYFCNFRITGVNILVTCSFIYMFIEVLSLAFFPPRWDFGVAVIGVIVWGILVLELFFEWLIRPSNYHQLHLSEKAYSPTVARHINTFHLITETIALLLFVPEFDCLATRECGKRIPFGGIDAALRAIFGPTRAEGALGRFSIGLTALRMVGLVRHWKIMWINRTFRDHSISVSEQPTFVQAVQVRSARTLGSRLGRKRSTNFDDDDDDEEVTRLIERGSQESIEEDRRLKQAATIGTALMVVNSHRALVLVITIVIVMPLLLSVLGQNTAAPNFVKLLQENNLLLNEANESSCEFLKQTIVAWLEVGATVSNKVPQYNVTEYVLWARVTPIRCDFLEETNGVITTCPENLTKAIEANSTYADFVFTNTVCDVWNKAPVNWTEATPEFYSAELGIRVGGISTYHVSSEGVLTIAPNGSVTNETFSVTMLANENHAVAMVNISEFLLLSSILILSLFGLAVLRGDAGRLVLGPLQRMLKIVVRYAENPLAQPAQPKKKKSTKRGGDHGDSESESLTAQLGNYETEQLISAITKIADLLRKCWGVAGAGIISTNLARTQDGMTVVFNPTVPGKRVYAIFGFLCIDGFSEQLRALDRDVMILINDVAKVIHDEVFRWALGNSGQCNKNLGAAFLMVFRIGDFNEVHERKARATDVVFSSDKRTSRARNLRRRGRAVGPAERTGIRSVTRQRGRRQLGDSQGESLALASLPGIQTFADRALLGMLKSFAGIYRDKNIQNWKKDFRLGAGVGAFNVNLMIGMDAGWAVEGAVGSEYKIDATYLSPHVNMASRMMSASKQYGVTLLLSQAVEELLSRPARDKLRHLDTVYVKGSSVAQRVFTYDARHQGVDFFLFERSPEQADLDAEAYTPGIWDTDQDLRAMRQHVTPEFQRKFKEGVGRYLAGEWKSAIVALKEADDIMITTVLEEGFIDYNPDEEIDGRIFDERTTDDEVLRIRNEMGDGACKCLITYMERRRGIPSESWNGVRPLTSK